MQVAADVRFAIVPDWLLDVASSGAVHLYAVLARYANSEGEAYPTRRTLATRMRVGLRTVDARIAELEELGALERTDCYRGNGSQTASTCILRTQPPAQNTAPPRAENCTPPPVQNSAPPPRAEFCTPKN